MSGDEVIGEVVGEFAAVLVKIDRSGNGPRLRIEDLRTGRIGHLDALELETLAWLPEERMRELLDPSLHRWKTEAPEGSVH